MKYAAALLSLLAWSAIAQDDSADQPGKTEVEEKKPRAKGMDQDRQVDYALQEYRKAYKAAETDQERATALETLAGLEHPKVIQELGARLDDPPAVRDVAVEMLAKIDRPEVAKILAAKARDLMHDGDFMQKLVRAMDRCRWNEFYLAMGEFAEKKTGGPRGDPGLSAITYGVILKAKETENPVFVEPLRKLLHRMDENLRIGAYGGDSETSKQYRRTVIEALRACSGAPEVRDAKEFDAWWARSKDAAMAKTRVIFWCPKVRKRWDRPATGSKRYCPHHEDRKKAVKDGSIEAFRTRK